VHGTVQKSVIRLISCHIITSCWITESCWSRANPAIRSVSAWDLAVQCQSDHGKEVSMVWLALGNL